MSERYVFQFDFGLAPEAPSAVLRSFEALARGEKPVEADLVTFRLGGFLDRNMMANYRDHVGTSAVVWETGIIDNPNNPYHAPSPKHGVRFSFVMHDDHRSNGGFALPFAVFDLVGEHGLFGVEFDETNRTALVLYFREFDDLIIQRIAAPSMAYPLPPDAVKNPESYLKGWKPAIAKGFEFGTFTRLTAADRAAILAEADAMFGPPEDCVK
jgi:hypothetical protein